jgi:hypothetical protein
MSGLPSNPSKSFIARNPQLYERQTNRVSPTAIGKQDSGNEPLAKAARAGLDPKRRLVRIKSFRLRVVDERNLFDKFFVDSLVYAGILFDDSPRWVKVEVEQVQCDSGHQERTEIEVSEI